MARNCSLSPIFDVTLVSSNPGETLTPSKTSTEDKVQTPSLIDVRVMEMSWDIPIPDALLTEQLRSRMSAMCSLGECGVRARLRLVRFPARFFVAELVTFGKVAAVKKRFNKLKPFQISHQNIILFSE